MNQSEVNNRTKNIAYSHPKIFFYELIKKYSNFWNLDNNLCYKQANVVE